MILIRLALMAVIFCAFYAPRHSVAADSIAFIDRDAFKNPSVQSLLSDHDFTQIAVIDLNNDSIDEYVLSRSVSNSLHHFEVLALMDGSTVSLARIRAQKLMLAYGQQHGVRSILGFKDANNDYEYDVYTWDSMRSSFSNVKNMKQKGYSQ